MKEHFDILNKIGIDSIIIISDVTMYQYQYLRY